MTVVILAAASLIAFAATWTDPFTTLANYVLSDSGKITVSNFVAKLVQQKPFHLHDTKTEFDTGTYTDTEIANDVGSVQTSIKLGDTGLTAYWPLNGTTGNIANAATAGLEDTKGTNEGTASNANGTGLGFAAAKFGNGVNFDGTDDVVNTTLISDNIVQGRNPFTIAVWAKHNGSAALKSLVTNSSIMINRSINLHTRNAGLGWAFDRGGTVVTDGAGFSSSDPWRHLVVVYDGSTIILYRDGVQTASQADTASLTMTQSEIFRIGGGNGVAYFPGLIDDVGIYNTALTASQVAAQYAAGVAVHMKSTATITPHAPKLAPGMPGLVSYWSLDASSGTVAADLVGVNKGTLTNMETPTDWVTGINGKGLVFDGVDEYAALSDFADPAKFTLSAWVKPAAVSGTKVIFEKFEAADDGFAIQLNGANAQARANTATATGTSTLAAGTWYHLGATYDGTNLKIYVNGTLETTTSAASLTFATGTAAANIGRLGYSPTGSYFNGTIDEVAIFNRALSANEILYLAGKKGETATYTSPVMDGEVAAATWDKLAMKYAGGPSTPLFTSRTVGDIRYHANAADLDQDGDIDVVGTYPTTGGWIYKFINNGIGSFTQTAIVASVGHSSSNTLDLDGDGTLDIVAVLGGTNELAWYANNGSATFGAKQSIDTTLTVNNTASPDSTCSLPIGDIDGDTVKDIATADENAIYWWKVNGNGTFGAKNTVASSLSPRVRTLSLVDLDGDGDLDLLGIQASTVNKAIWWENDGTPETGTWTPHDIATVTNIYSVTSGDVDGDGDRDVVIGLTSGTVAKLCLQTSAGIFGSPTDITTSSLTKVVDLGDVNGDGKLDLFYSQFYAVSTSGWVPGNGDGTFGTAQADSGGYSDDTSGSSRFFDFDGDGNIDILHGPAVFFNSPWKVTTIQAFDSANVTTGDIDRDGDQDIVATSDTGDEVAWWSNTGNGTFGSKLTIGSAFDGAYQVVTADIDNDGDLDVVSVAMTATTGDEVAWWANDGTPLDGGWTKYSIETAFSAPTAVAVGDLDKDGDIDIVSAADGTTDQLVWWANDGTPTDGGWVKTVIQSTWPGTYTSIELADLDGDGDLDVISGTYSGLDLSWWANNGTGIFGAKQTIVTGYRPREVNAVDLDRDGDLDLSIVGLNELLVKFNTNGLGTTWSSTTQIISLSNGWAGKAADLDGDGDIDLTFGSTTGGSFWFANDGTGSFGSRQYLPPFYGLAFADFDQNGTLDIAQADGAANYMRVDLQQPYATIQFQTRTDSNASPATSYLGPDGTALTYYGSGAGIKENTAGSARYAQYKATFYRNDTTIDPMLKNVQADYTALVYSTANPYVTPATGQAFTYLTSFAETATKPVGSEIKYILSPNNGTYWYYHNGTAWVSSNGTYAQANLASAINTNIAAFDDKAYTDTYLPENSDGTLKFRAFLNSDGTALPTLDSVAIGYESGTITMTAPNGAETWKAGTTKNITWTSTGILPADLTIEYTTDGTNYTGISTSEANDGTYAWSIASNFTPSTTLKVRARSASVPSIRDVSNANFTIADLNIALPNGGEFWKVGTNQNITWTKAGTVPNDLVVEYAADGTTFSTSLGTALNATTGTPLAWNNLPGSAVSGGATAKVRVRSASATELTDVSNAAFTLFDLKVTSPNTAVNWPAGSSQNITWTHNGIPGTTIKLQLSTTGCGGTFNDIAGATGLAKGVSGGTFAWTVPSILGTQNCIKVVDETQLTNVTDASDIEFEIGGSIITVSKPAAAEVVGVGTIKKINWTVTGPIPSGAKMRFHYSSDGLANNDVNKVWTLIDNNVVPTGGTGCDTGVTGCYDWALAANFTTSNTVVVRVQDDPTWDTIGGQNAVDGFSSVFRVTGTITVQKPDGGEKWAYGAAHTITYQTQGTIPNIKITAAKDGNFANTAGGNIVTITASTSSTGSFSWTPVVGDAATTMKVRVENAADAEVKDESNAAFILSGITVTAPSAASRVKAGDPYSITWTQSGITNVKIEYAEDGSAYNNTIIASVAVGANSYSWTLPTKTMTGFRVKLTDADAVPAANGTDTALATDASDASTVIYGTITLVAPNGNEDWSASNPHDVTWTVSPSGANVVPNVKIFYTTSAFATETLEVDTGVTKPSNNNPGNGTGKYIWSPAFTNGTVKLRIVDAADPAVSAGAAAPSSGQNQDDSDAFFVVSGVSITAPASGASWLVGSQQLITAPYTGSLANAKLEYSVDGGTNYALLGTGTIETSTDGTTWTPQGGNGSNITVPAQPFRVRWTVPDNISTNVKLKITQVNADGSAMTGAKIAFSPTITITGALSITTPAALNVGASPNISWTKTGTITSQTLAYSTDGGTNWTNIATAVTGTSQSWTVSDAIGNNVKVRITDTTARANGSPAISSTSNAFSIKSNLAITAPIVTDDWGANRSYNITGTMTGTVTALKIEYVDVATTTATTIVASQAVSGTSFTYSWGIPATILNASRNLASDPIKAYKIRVTDVTSGHTGNAAATLDSPNFDIVYYKITWAIRDSATSGLLTALNVGETFDGDGSTTWSITDNTLNSSGLYRYYRYGTYTSSWSKALYTTAGANSWVADSEKTVTVYLESDAEKNVQYEVKVVPVLDENNDILNMKTWMERLGKIINNEVIIGNATIDIFDGATKIVTLTKTPAQLDLDTTQAATTKALGYSFSYGPPTNLVRGKVYFIRASIGYSGSTYTSGNNYTVPGGMKPVTDLLGAVGDTSSASTLFGKIAATLASTTLAQTSAANASTKADAVKNLIGAIGDAASANTLFGQLGAAADTSSASTLFGKLASVTAVLGDPTSTSAPAAGTLARELRNPWKSLVRDPIVKKNTDVVLRFKGETGKTATVDIYDPSNSKLLSAAAMTEIGSTGIYEYKYKPTTKGDHTVLFKTSTGALDSFVMTVTDAYAYDAATDAKSAKSSADSAFVFAQQAAGDTDAILADLSTLTRTPARDNTAKLSEIQGMMSKMESRMSSIFSSPESTNLNDMRGKLDDVLRMINRIASSEKPNVNLENIYKAASQTETTATTVKNSVAEVKALAEVTQKMVEKQNNKPIVQTWFETGSVIFKLLVMNPSETDEQEFPLHAYLPREAKPEIIERITEGVEIAFDSERDSYFVQGLLTLKPGESKVIEIEMTDIWLIEESRLIDLKDQAEKVMQELEGTPYQARAEGLFANIQVLVTQIFETQKDDSATPEEHINLYRENLKKMRDCELDLVAMRRFLASAAGKTLESSEASALLEGVTANWDSQAAAAAEGTPSVKATWKLIFMIMGFIGLVGLISFGMWQRELHKLLKSGHSVDTTTSVDVIPVPGTTTVIPGASHSEPPIQTTAHRTPSS